MRTSVKNVLLRALVILLAVFCLARTTAMELTTQIYARAYTVATLPTPPQGYALAMVTDFATGCGSGGGGGSTVAECWYNGTIWVLAAAPRIWSSPDGIVSNAALPTSGFPATPFGYNYMGGTETITAIKCAVDGGTATTIALTDNSSNNLLSASTCTCSTSWASCTQSGTHTTVSSGGYMLVTYTPDGTAKVVSLVVSGTY